MKKGMERNETVALTVETWKHEQLCCLKKGHALVMKDKIFNSIED